MITADDFRRARFATHPTGGLAHRAGSSWSLETRSGDDDRAGDGWMAAHGWVPVREAAPLSLDTLREAWENAEVETQDSLIREGDVYISTASKSFGTLLPFVIGVAGPDGKVVGYGARVLSRAPRREPHEDLCDAIIEVWPVPNDHIDIGTLAYRLHERGVRVTGGDDQ